MRGLRSCRGGWRLPLLPPELQGGATAHRFDLARSNRNWQAETRPILDGFWHCRYFIQMLARYGRGLDAAPDVLPYGWAAVLYLYGLR
jgi:hypothetical protein